MVEETTRAHQALWCECNFMLVQAHWCRSLSYAFSNASIYVSSTRGIAERNELNHCITLRIIRPGDGHACLAIWDVVLGQRFRRVALAMPRQRP